MKKNDFILASVMVFIALVWFITTKLFMSEGNELILYRSNEAIETRSLSDEGEYSVYDDTSTKEILRYKVSDGHVEVTYSTCPDKLCMYQRKISKNNETIVCLPNKIIIEILNDDKNDDVDAVAY